MGFMKGFGESFSRSFELGNQRIHEKKQDNFRVAWDAYSRNQAKYDAEEAAWQKAIRTGETIVQRYPDVPPEASTKAAEWIMAGYSASDVEKMIVESSWTPVEETEVKPEMGGAMGNMDTQMQGAGLTPPDPTATPTPNQGVDDPGLLSNVFGPGGLFGEGPGKQTDVQEAQGRILEQTGMTQEEYDRVNAGYTPPTATVQATANTATATSDPLVEFGLEDGVTPAKYAAAVTRASVWEKSENPADKEKAARFRVLQPVIEATMNETDPEAQAEMYKMLSPTIASQMEKTEKKVGTVVLVNEGRQLTELVMQNPEVLTLVGAGAAGLSDLGTEFTTLMETIGKIGSDQTNPNALNDSLAAVETWASDMAARGDLGEISTAYRMYAGALVRFIYASGKTLGQTGNGFSNVDYQQIMKSIATSSDQYAFVENMQSFLKQRIYDIDTDLKLYAQVPAIQAVMKDGGSTMAEMFKPFLAPVKEVLSPEDVAFLDTDYKKLNSTDKSKSAAKQGIMSVPGVGDAQSDPVPAEYADRITPEAWEEMTPEMRALFR